MVENNKVNYSYIRRVASELVEESLTAAGYKAKTVSFIKDSLATVISSETEIDVNAAKSIQNQLLVLLDSEPSVDSMDEAK
jgi:ribosome maturation factor RimP